MDLSINQINRIRANNIRFKGMKGTLSADNIPVYKFIAPPHKNNQKVVLEIVALDKDRNGNYLPPDVDDISEIEFEGETLEIEQKDIKELSDGFAYRYKLQKVDTDGKVLSSSYEIDNFRSVKSKDGQEFNFIESGKFYGVTPKIGSMRHSFLDSDGVLEKGALKPYDPEFVRNHFNKLGGSIKGLTYLLKQGQLDPYTYIISTPDIGADGVSSHRYWPNNQYQCANMQDFKDFNFELFKKGKGYVADGAFTSQGLQSPMVQHVLKWGDKSPFYNMLKIGENPALGVLPNANMNVNDESNPYNHIGVRLVNSSYRDGYDCNKPTYIQFFDKRLVTEEQLKSNEPIKAYANKTTEDHYDITTHQDSVLPYYFEIDESDSRIKNKVKQFGPDNVLLFKDIENPDEFLKFNNFSITDKHHASGATYWDGNVDIIKMNLSNPTIDPKNRKGFEDARNYLYGVASFWTEAIQSDLLLRTAKLKPSGESLEVAKIIKNNGIENIDEIRATFNNAEYSILKQNKTAKDYVNEFPIQSIEVSPELSVIFAEPEFRKEFFTEELTQTLTTLVETIVRDSVPSNYKENEEYKAYVTKAYANEILRHAFVYALAHDKKDEVFSPSGEINLDVLKTITLKSFLDGKEATSPKEERKAIQNKLRVALNYFDTSKPEIACVMSNELKDITLEDFKMAETIIEQGKGGLNWRFDAAKDIADLDAVKSGDATMEEVWIGNSSTPGIQEFWSKFIQNIKKYNPSSYIVCEITCLGDFIKGYEDKATSAQQEAFDKKLSKKYNGVKLGDLPHEERMPYQKEMNFLAEINATTSSNYEKYFNNLSAFLGVNPEHGSDATGNAGNVGALKWNMETFLKYASPNIAMLSHMFVDNHDKPFLLHTLPLDMGLYLCNNVGGSEKYFNEITGNRNPKENISSKAIAVGQVMYETINELYKDDNDKKEKLIASLQNLVNGKRTPDSDPNYQRAEAFGFLPFEVTIRDMFKNAGLEDQDEIRKFHWNIMEKPAKQFESLWQVMNSLVGVPTIFNGTEYAQTGYETPSKNVYVGNRGQIRHDLKDKEGYKEHYEKMQAISGLSKDLQMTALSAGFPISCDVVENNSIWPVYKYDEKGSKVLSLITNVGVQTGVKSQDMDITIQPKELLSIPISKNGNCPFEEGTILKRMVYRDGKYETEENVEYKVQNGSLTRNDNQKIVIDDTVAYFYVPRKIPVAFQGSLYNQAH